MTSPEEPQSQPISIDLEPVVVELRVPDVTLELGKTAVPIDREAALLEQSGATDIGDDHEEPEYPRREVTIQGAVAEMGIDANTSSQSDVSASATVNSEAQTSVRTRRSVNVGGQKAAPRADVTALPNVALGGIQGMPRGGLGGGAYGTETYSGGRPPIEGRPSGTGEAFQDSAHQDGDSNAAISRPASAGRSSSGSRGETTLTPRNLRSANDPDFVQVIGVPARIPDVFLDPDELSVLVQELRRVQERIAEVTVSGIYAGQQRAIVRALTQLLDALQGASYLFNDATANEDWERRRIEIAHHVEMARTLAEAPGAQPGWRENIQLVANVCQILGTAGIVAVSLIP